VLLAFDTATPHVTVALYDGGSVVATYESAESMRHGEMLAPGIRQVLSDANATAGDVSEIAVGVGPGPFTGLRVGLVTARTFAFVRGIEVYGVCTLDILAAEAADAGMDEFVVATDARRKEVYLGSYAGGRRVSGPEVVKPFNAKTDGPVVGRGGVLYPDAFPNAVGPEHPSASVLCGVVANQRFEIVEPDPLYLRRPDAAEPGKPKRVS
jgi:tRNA threonylcarbamoyl adenosine modification protein YeaZ